MTNKELFQKVKDLKLPIGEYALFGSAPIGIRGLRDCHDIDIIVTEKLFDEYKHKHGWKLKKTQEPDKYSDGLIKNNIEMWKDWWEGHDIRKLIKEAEIIDGLPFVKLEEVLRWKKFIVRKKDLKDVEMIEKFLNKKSKII